MMNDFQNSMHFIITFAAIVVLNMSHWGNFKEIARLNTFWSTSSYSGENE